MKLHLSLLLTILVLSAGCSTRPAENPVDENACRRDTLTLHSSLLTLIELENGTKEAVIKNPWTSDERPLQHLILVHKDSVAPTSVAKDAKIVRVPVAAAGVYSSVHTGGIKEIGALEAIKGVADVSYFPKGDTILELVKLGQITDVGSSQAPSVESIAKAGLEIIIRSPMEGLAAGELPPGVTAVEMADYMETSPVGRAEWILLLGALFDKMPQASAMIDSVVSRYSDLHLKAMLAQSPKPKVLTETEQSGVWYVPGGKSYMGRFIADAGGISPWGDTDASGSIPLGIEAVAAKAMDADVWLTRSYGYRLDGKALVKMNPRYGSFRPVKERTVWNSNTAEVPLFDDIAFHPERLLEDYIAIFHPEVLPGHKMRYFTKGE